MPFAAPVKVAIYDLLGREIENFVNKAQPAGRYSITWSAVGFPSGIYFYKIDAGDISMTKKMFLLK
jgi:hypothetical protein